MNKAFFEKDIMALVEKPDKEVTKKYNKAFADLNKSLKENVDTFIKKEHKRIQKTAQKAETYILI